MEITRMIDTNGVFPYRGFFTFQLTPEEMVKAYEIQQHIYDISDVKEEIEFRRMEYEESYGIDAIPVSEEELKEMANLLRMKLDEDCEASFLACREDAVTEVLKQRFEKDDGKDD